MAPTERDYPTNLGIADLDTDTRSQWHITVANFIAAMDDFAADDRAGAQGSLRYILAEATRGRWGLFDAD